MPPDDFAAFYEAAHGHRPFPWQSRLAERLLADDWPRTLALPTASGKTSVIDAVIFALARQSALPAAQRTVPLRLCFVVDRRLIVDEATEHARRLADALAGAETGIVAEVATRLKGFGAPQPLQVTTLRGGMILDDAWAAWPNQPAVIATTVDQVGSRLLFRGYGLSPFRWPVEAGLLGNDTLFVIDEAHLSQPFIDTLEAVTRYRGWAEQPLITPFRVLVMSATPNDPEAVFALDNTDLAHPELGRRLRATKLARLQPAELKPKRPKQLKEEERSEADHRFERSVVTEAWRLTEDGSARIVGVVVNRVATARAVFEELRRDARALLLTGRIRPHDRDRLLAEWLPRIRAGRERQPDQPLFVVATQTVEVGANLDFDALVTESAPLSALRQRAGRLDRLGRRGQSTMAVLMREGVDPVYGELTYQTHRWLSDQAGKGMLDFGALALNQLIDGAETPPPRNDPPRAPVLLPAVLEQWVQTSPAPHPDPDLAPFLHGPQPQSRDVQLIWRADLTETNIDDWPEIVALMPPRTQESLTVPLHAVLAWLAHREGDDFSDLEGADNPESRRRPSPRKVLLWRGEDSTVVDPARVRSGATLVVPAAWGGCDRYGWHPEIQDPVEDLAESVQTGRQRQLRVHHDLFDRWPEREGMDTVRQGLDDLLEALNDPELRDPVQARTELIDALEIVLDASERVAHDARLATYPDGRGVVFISGATFIDEDDQSSLTRPVELAAHLDGVGDWAGRFAIQCGLEPALVDTLELAGRLHDLGKAEPRFQAMLYGGDELAAVGGGLRAKSGMNPSRQALRRARELARLPKGWRHEFLSVALIEAEEQLLATTRLPELAAYLVGVHHGRGRPFPPVVIDDDPQTARVDYRGHHFEDRSDHGLERLDSGWTERFWRLQRRHGYWGLAYLEALLRLADRARSIEEVEHG